MLATVVSFMLGHLVFALMLAVGLGTRPRDLLQAWDEPGPYLRALLVIELAVPLLSMAVVALLALPRTAAVTLLVMAACPGAPFISRAARAEGEHSSPVGLNLLLIVSLLAPVTVSAWLWVFSHVFPLELTLGPGDVVGRIVPKVLVPLLLGLILGQVAPRAAAALRRAVNCFFTAAFLVAILVVLYLGAPVLLGVPPRALLGLLGVVTGSALLGYWAGAPDANTRRTVAIAAGSGNPGMAAAVVAMSFPGVQVPALLGAYLILRWLALLPFERWEKRRRNEA